MEPDREPRKGYRGGFFDNLDVPAIVSFLACLLLFVLAMVGVKSVDYSSLNKPSLEDLPERVAKILMPLKPPGKAAPPKGAVPAAKAARPGPGASREPDAVSASAASAAARIERSRRSVSERIVKAQERITKAAVLSILSGTGPAAKGRPVGRAAGSPGLVDWGDLDAQLGKLEGLTKFDAKQGEANRDGAAPATKGDEAASARGIDKLVKGFQNAKVSALKRIGVSQVERPQIVETNTKYKGGRSPQEMAAFISKKQAVVSMLYEERLKVNPALEGKVTVVLTIEEDGRVSDARVVKSESTLDDPDFHEELIRRIKRWIFPPARGGPVELKSPFVFRPA